MVINKDTKIFGSFSSTPGNNGCEFFNNKFQQNNINALYKSFYSDNILKSIEAVKTLNIAGFAVSMPFKTEIIQYLDETDPNASCIGAVNTVVNQNGYLKGYNTDWVGVYSYLSQLNIDFVNILGNGGFSKAVQFALGKLNIPFYIVTRKNWHELPNLKGVLFNSTPIEIKSNNTLIDGRPFTEHGKQIALLQAEEQFKIYTNEHH
jgi:shikimate dehydrogenase